MEKSDDTVRIQAYLDLLSEAKTALQDMRSRDKLRPPTFNLFLVLGCERREATHSAMLAHLLDPYAGHAQGVLFLRRFFDVVQRAAARQGKEISVPVAQNASGWFCGTEFPLPQNLGQADILLRGPNCLMIIENKIDAGDQKEQLQRYWNYLQLGAAGRQSRILVYLTPDGRPPTSQSIGGRADLAEALIRLSYHEDIYEVVHSIVAVTEAVSVSEILRQYGALVRSL